MLGQLKSPPKGFETVVKRHFYIKKAEILKDLYKWIERAEKVEALYTITTLQRTFRNQKHVIKRHLRKKSKNSKKL
jgi:hypothetical protein